jgi:hypothetical protein
MKVVDKAYDHGVKPGIEAYEKITADPKFSADGRPLNSPNKQTPPPVPIRPGTLQTGPPALPARVPSPQKGGQSVIGEKIPLASQIDTKLGAHGLPSYTETVHNEPEKMSPATPTAGTSTPPSKRPLLNRIFLAGEVVLSSLEATAHDLINTGTAAASSAAG